MWQRQNVLSTMCVCIATLAVEQLENCCSFLNMLFFFPKIPWESLPQKKKKGTWAEEQGLRVGDQLLAIGGASVKEHLRRSNGSMEPATLMGPQRIMIQLQAAQEDVKMAGNFRGRLMDVVIGSCRFGKKCGMFLFLGILMGMDEVEM